MCYNNKYHMNYYWGENEMPTYDNKNAAIVTIAKGKNPRQLFKHQEAAMFKLNEINKKKDFSAIIVLPTGAGKTLTSVYWLLKNAINKRKRVLWIAHRHLLLDQAAEAFVNNGYSDLLPNRTSYKYRIISGIHDKPIHIKGDEDILIAGKDSIIKNLQPIGDWMSDEDVYLVIDEAHHAVARTYQKIIRYVREEADKNSTHIKIIGLTATPYRTNEAEKAALGAIFTDDIIFSIDTDTLIKRGILSTPRFETIETHVLAGEKVNSGMIKRIAFSDNLPEDLANDIASNKDRNRLIVNHYLDNQIKYQQTIVFALNVNHAIQLNALFKKYGVKSDYIVSDIKDLVTGISRSREDNNRNIVAYREKKLQVLINVNILTEGTDLPQTKTVFLARPTVSKVLMTQMVGRALRGETAGGTKDAYVVSFIDDWEDKIGFEAPETILLEGTIPAKKEYEYRKQIVRFVAISLIEEFTRITDETVDTKQLESLPFSERIPVGMYMVSYMEEDTENEVSIERNSSVLVYNSSKEAYEEFVSNLSKIMRDYGIEGDHIEEELVEKMIDGCREKYFSKVILPPCKNTDIEALLKYYAYSGKKPVLTPIEEIDRSKVNLSYIAQDMLDLRLDDFEKRIYLEKLWNDENTLLKLYYTDYEFFKRQLDKEIDKIVYGVVSGTSPNVKYDERTLEEMPLQQIRECYPAYGEKLRNAVFESAFENGQYKCVHCGMTSPHRKDFQVDHIVPMSKGGKTVIGNLQLLCRKCNGIKGDKEENKPKQPLASREISDDILPSVNRKGDKLIVRIGDEEKAFGITQARKERGYLTFQIAGGKYRYFIRKKKLIKI